MNGYSGVLDYTGVLSNGQGSGAGVSSGGGSRGMAPTSSSADVHAETRRRSNSIGARSSSNTSVSSQSTSSFSMFPMVEKMYRVRITEDIERDLRYLGQSRADALISEFDMVPLKDTKGIQMYELAEQEFYTMKAVVMIPKSSIHDVMNLMDMPTTANFRDTMGDIFGPLFLDGVVLYSAPKDVTRPNESLSVNWMALQSSKPHLPHRDYVFLKYGDCFSRSSDQYRQSMDDGMGNNYVGASIWESIEFDGCGPLPESQNVVRLKFRRCGFVFEESQATDQLRVSFFLSESHPGRGMVSNLTKAWMTKMLMCISDISGTLITKHLSEQTLLNKNEFSKDGHCCFICLTKFTMLRRKQHCRICGDVVCGKCSNMKTVRQNGQNKEVRICLQCTSASTNSMSRGSTGSGLQRQASKPSMLSSSMSCSSVASSESAYSYHEEEVSADFNTKQAKQPIIMEERETPTHNYYASQASYSSQSSSAGGANDMILLSSIDTSASTVASAISSGSSSDMVMLTKDKPASIRENTTFSYALSYTSRQEWPKAPMPRNEVPRLAKVRSLHLTDPENQFQDMVDVAATTLSCSIAAICVIGDKTGYLLARLGLAKREVSRNILFDAHTIMSASPTVVLDAKQDVRFVNNPLVTDGNILFYAGVPLVTSDGHYVGSFSVADQVPRQELTGDQLIFLQNLADLAIRGIEANTARMLRPEASGSTLAVTPEPSYVPPPPEMDAAKAALTMQELLKTAYDTQCQVRMQVHKAVE
ncbi:hypothetical protein SDRG_08778 [Saprolegnia diclina VS20]|uniref:FYVE-type domain-containing protein n=1 Tax=Saprolegnia diclina (strain VS20) TaxID=1156394 RepID=T0Q730_SAPDV|nr:hypothetical protein SDRG_08778 [Saprolegnia diclina VS20]EQC33674.1 hypothetical protein SDRG_08778 [Saprolegnia diclina VS20]|eukprot:XP_008612897.1 hypothetical protein SDRG_08778 [Saprolegnia diclina VS20]